MLIVAVQQIKFLLEALAKFSKREKKIYHSFVKRHLKLTLFAIQSCMLLAKIIIIFDLLKINEDV